MSTNVKPSEVANVACFGPSKVLFTLLNNKVLAHNDKYPRARIKTEQIRKMFARKISSGLDYALAYVDTFLRNSGELQDGKFTKVIGTANLYSLTKGLEVALDLQIAPESITAAREELKNLKLDQVKPEDLYFEAVETHVPIWNQLI